MASSLLLQGDTFLNSQWYHSIEYVLELVKHFYFSGLSLTSMSSSAGSVLLLLPQPQSDMSHHEDDEDAVASEVSADRNDWHDAGSDRMTTENGEGEGRLYLVGDWIEL